MSKYTKNILDKYCNDNNVELIKDYSNEKIWCELSIEGKCSNSECVNIFKKSFKHLLKNGSLCSQCCRGKNENVILYNWKMLKNYCDEKKIILDRDYSKETLNSKKRICGKCENTDCSNHFDCVFRNLISFGAYCKECFYKKRTEITKETNKEKYGVEFISQVKEIRQKAEETMLEKYGAKYTTQSKELYDKMKHNNKEKYGVENISQVPEIKEKIMVTCLERYGCENPLQNEEIKQKSKESCLNKYGVEHVSHVPEIRQKAKNTTMERYGFEYATQSNIVQERIVQTNFKIYGVERPSQCKEVQNKTKETCLRRYGVEHYFQSDDKKVKSINTCLERYGCENPSQDENIKNKKEETCMTNHGVKNPFQMEETKEKNRVVMRENHDEILNKSKQTCLNRYGVEHPAQNTDIMEKCSKNAYKRKEYEFPSGKIVIIQGAEHYALDEILQTTELDESNIIIGSSNVPVIWYEGIDGKQHKHYVDIFIPSQNKMIEVKSTWTAEKNKDIIFLKQHRAKVLGYEYEIWVYDKKGIKVEIFK